VAIRVKAVRPEILFTVEWRDGSGRSSLDLNTASALVLDGHAEFAFPSFETLAAIVKLKDERAKRALKAQPQADQS
jgi:hypothetical protein